MTPIHTKNNHIKKRTYKILKNLAQFLCLYPFFQIFYKAYLQNLKKPSTIFLLTPFFKYFKKHTYKSQKHLFLY